MQPQRAAAAAAGQRGGDAVERRAQLVEPLAARAPRPATISAPGSSAAASSLARAGSARSAFVIATTPVPTPSAASTAACSRVCGITPSSAATTIRYRSMPVAPATIVRTKRSWPGTSTTDSRRPDGRSSGA